MVKEGDVDWSVGHIAELVLAQFLLFAGLIVLECVKGIVAIKFE